MSKHLFAFLLRELERIRLVCKGCGTAVEIKTELLLDSASKPLKCAGCPREFRIRKITGEVVDDALDHLARAICELKKDSMAFDCEFILPAKDDPKKPSA